MAMEQVARVLALASLMALARACAVPHGGCRGEVCAKFASVDVSNVWYPTADYSLEATWSQGQLSLIGYVMGRYNRLVNGGSYNRAGIKDTPALNYERFDLQTGITDPKTGQPYATASTEQDLVSCCNKCAQTDGCYLFQFFPADTPASYNGGVACYLLSGGTSTWDWAERGTPFAGSPRRQSAGARLTIPPSFVGGRCNGSAGVVDDPHFTGAHGTRFDFNGEVDRSFCLTSDASLHINGLLKGYKEERTEGATQLADGKGLRTWVREVGFLWKDAQGQQHTLHLVARNGPQQERGSGFVASAGLDGQRFSLPKVVNQEAKGAGDLSVVFSGVSQVGRLDVEHYHLRIGTLLDMTLSVRPAHPQMQAPGDAEVHFNLLINELASSEKIHGVLGQTYRNDAKQIAKATKYIQLTQLLNGPIQADGKSGQGFLEGETKDYMTSSVLKPDCKFSVFQ